MSEINPSYSTQLPTYYIGTALHNLNVHDIGKNDVVIPNLIPKSNLNDYGPVFHIIHLLIKKIHQYPAFYILLWYWCT